MAGETRIFNRETRQQLIGFSLVGAANTLIHLMMITGLVELFSVHAVPANGMAFITANLFSFWVNSRWSFRAAVTRQRYVRFLAVSLLGLTISLLASAVAEVFNWHYLAGVALLFCIMPLLTFFSHKFWTYAK